MQAIHEFAYLSQYLKSITWTQFKELIYLDLNT